MTVQPHGNPMNIPDSGNIQPPEDMLNQPYTPPQYREGDVGRNSMRIPVDETSYLFGPGVGQQFDEYSEELPEEIKGFFAENELDDKAFYCKLLTLADGAQSGKSEYVRSWKQAFPSEEWIANNYGPGEYELVFSWRGKKDGSLKDKTHTKRAEITISEKYRDQYDQFQLDKYLKKTKENKKVIQSERMKARFEREIDPLGIEADAAREPKDPRREAREYLRETMEMATMMGINQRQPPAVERSPMNVDNFVKIGAMIMPVALALINKMGNGGTSLVNMMLEQSQKHTQNLIELMKVKDGEGSGSRMIKEIKDMVVGSLDIKETINGSNEQDSTVNKVLEAVISIAPMLAAFVGMKREQIAASPLAGPAKQYINSNPDFVTVMGDRSKIILLVKNLDAKVGWEQTDAVISFGEIERPEECPRREDQRYPAGDQRNSPAAVVADENPMGDLQ